MRRELYPFFSILIIVGTLLSLVVLQMEERRMGYVLLKLSRENKMLIEEKREKSALLAKMTRPQQVERLAQSRLTFRKVQANQIIHMSGSHFGQDLN